MTELKLVKDKRKESLYIFLVMLAVFIIKAGIALIQLPIQVKDEVDYLIPIAYLGGYKWDYVFEEAAYYGQGFTILLYPLVVLIKNPYILYKTILVVYAFIESFICLICFRITRDYLGMKKSASLLISFALSFWQLRRITQIGNESIILLISWLTVFLLILLYQNRDNKRKKFLYTIVLSFLLGYSYTVHNRMIVLYAVVAIIVVLLLITIRRFILSLKAIIALPVFYVLANSVVSYFQDRLIKDLVGEAVVHNSLTQVGGMLGNIKYLFEEYGLHAFLNTILGQMNTANVMSVGFFAFSTCVVFVVAYKVICKKCHDDRSIIIAILVCFGFIGFYGMIISQAITWLSTTSYTLSLGVGPADIYTLSNTSRAFIYLRYAMPYSGPMLLGAFAFLRIDKNKKTMFISMVTTIVLQIYWLIFVLPYLYNNKNNVASYIPFSLQHYENQASWNYYLPGTIITIISAVVLYYLVVKNKTNFIAFILATVLVYQYCYYGIVHTNESSHRADDGYVYIDKLEEKFDLGDELVVTYRAQAYCYQFMNMSYSVVLEYTPDTEIIFCSNHNIWDIRDELFANGYRCFVLGEDEDEYVFISNNELAEYTIELGYEEMLQNNDIYKNGFGDEVK